MTTSPISPEEHARTSQLRDYAKGLGTRAIGNVDVKVDLPRFDYFEAMMKRELDLLRSGTVRVANYDLSIAYGSDRNDGLAQMVRSGALDDQNPVLVEVVTRLLIDRLTRDWAA